MLSVPQDFETIMFKQYYKIILNSHWNKTHGLSSTGYKLKMEKFL